MYQKRNQKRNKKRKKSNQEEDREEDCEEEEEKQEDEIRGGLSNKRYVSSCTIEDRSLTFY